jgi:rubrerythrin
MNENIIDVLKHNELMLSELYTAFSDAIPVHRYFWKRLALEERAHGDVLDSLNKQAKFKNLFIEGNKFRTEAVKTSIAYTERQIKDARSGNMTPIKAISVACDLENSMIEKNFFEVFKPGSQSIISEFAALKEHTRKHSGLISELLEQERQKIRAVNLPDLKKKVVEAQRDILRVLSEFEGQLAVVYKRFSELYPDTSASWVELAAEENRHADRLNSLLSVLERGEIFKNLGRFPNNVVLEMINGLKQCLEKADKGELSEKEAIAVAGNSRDICAGRPFLRHS